MNKARRHELKMLKYKKRMRLYRFKRSLWLNPTSTHNLHAFRSHSCPCSCSACQQPEDAYNRAKEIVTKRNLIKEYADIWAQEYQETVDYVGESYARAFIITPQIAV